MPGKESTELATRDQESEAARQALGTVRATGGLATLKEALQSAATVEDDPTPRMIEWIMAAPTEDWGDMWKQLPNLRDNAGRELRLLDFRVAASSLEGNELEAFLIGDVIWTDTGERELLSIGSTMCIAQAVTLKNRGQLPADLKIVRKETKTRAGFQPIHFSYLGKPANPALPE